MKARKLPPTDAIEELAKFWDTHDLTEFEGELEEVTEPVFVRGAETVIAIRLSPEEAEAVKKIAMSKGIEPMALIREWVLDRL